MTFPLATSLAQKAQQQQQQPPPQSSAPQPPASKSAVDGALRRRASTDRRASEAARSDSAGRLEALSVARSGPSVTASSFPPAAQHLCLLLDITAQKPRRIGKYILGKQLGKGAFGTVRLGKDPATGESWCIAKLMIP